MVSISTVSLPSVVCTYLKPYMQSKAEEEHSDTTKQSTSLCNLYVYDMLLVVYEMMYAYIKYIYEI